MSGLTPSATRLKPSRGALVNNVAYFGPSATGAGARNLDRAGAVAHEHPDRKFPFYSSAAVVDGTVVLAVAMHGGRGSMRRPAARAGPMTPPSHRLLAGHCRQTASTSESNDGRSTGLDLASGSAWQQTGRALSALPPSRGRIVIGRPKSRFSPLYLTRR